ncbi:MAG: hypothetical protein LBD94_01910 [Rickettsiales bacterium]|nr:hypothetical protein [Rickettsiales bacterium]
MGVKEQIFNELGELESIAGRLRGAESAFKKQTDLEIAILKKQVAKLNETRATANDKINQALSVLGTLE